ncbi:substrate-binding domain-containing protein [Streptomyces sp. NPDC005890]|uniref:substrate-binding domain-containing protein n=1 Tax=Streptomyces sp. NPDC005890 TaxID=3154568 RepID=UPI0033EBEA94
MGVPRAAVAASAAATGHLVERGCRRVAVVCGELRDEVDVSGLWYAGYRQALAAAGLPADPGLVRGLPALTMAAAARQARVMVAEGLDFDGVFCVTDTVAMGVLRGLADAGVRVPERVKVIGFHNVDESAFLVPSLSTVDPDHDLMAGRAVELLVARMAAGARRRSRRSSSARSPSSSASPRAADHDLQTDPVCLNPLGSSIILSDRREKR